MLGMSGCGAAVRLSVLAGAAALALAGLSGGAQAFPRGAAVTAAAGPEAVQFYDDGYAPPMHRPGRHHRHAYDRYGENAHPGHPGHAGLYDCGPGGRNTRLSRKACGGNDRFAHIDRYGYYD